MELEISKRYLSYSFNQMWSKLCEAIGYHWSVPKLYENIGYCGKSKCLLEYCHERLASST